MRLLITAGNTLTPIDRVRGITNIFTGRTGTEIALHAHDRGHEVALLTSTPALAQELRGGRDLERRWTVLPYRTFDDLHTALAPRFGAAAPDAFIHSAAVSDYYAAGVYAADGQTRFRVEDARWEATAQPTLIDMSAGKVKSDAPELWLRLLRTPKLVDLVRRDWGFAGVLVKFKLEVGVSDDRLLEIGERSRQQSQADLMVANTLDGAATEAFLGPVGGGYQRVPRAALAASVVDHVERLQREKSHG